MKIDEIVIELGDVSEKTLGNGSGACEAFGQSFVPTSIDDPNRDPNVLPPCDL